MVTRARRQRFIIALVLLPFFILLIVMASAQTGRWQTGVVILGVWAGLSLFIISFLFQALVFLMISIYTFNQGMWIVSFVTFLMSLYLVFATSVSDADVARVETLARMQAPEQMKRLDRIRKFKQDPRIILGILLFTGVGFLCWFWGVVLERIIIWILQRFPLPPPPW